MPYNGFEVNTNTWSGSSKTTATGKSNNDDLLNELLQTLGNFVNEMSPLFFLGSIQNLKTAIEDFGQGMSAALACVSIDLQVVASGLSAAAVAYAATDHAIADTFAHLDTQLAYYTNTATSVSWTTPTASQQSALNTLSTSSSSGGSGDWLSQFFSNLHIPPPPPALAPVVFVGIILLGIALSPVGV
jgi:hypothetical protein